MNTNNSSEFTTLISMIVGLVISLAMMVCFTILLINHVIDISQAGYFLTVLAVPLASLAGLPLFQGALKAPSSQQMTQLSQVVQQALQSQQTVPQSPLVIVHAAQPDVQVAQDASPPVASVPSVSIPPQVSETIPQPVANTAPPVQVSWQAQPVQDMTTSINPQMPAQPAQQFVRHYGDTQTGLPAIQKPSTGL